AIRFTNDKDLGVYVARLFMIHTDVTSSNDEELKAGDTNTHINVKVPDNDVQTLDFGNVLIPEYNNDSNDLNTEYHLFLPFYGWYEIDSKYIGQTINLKYVVNVIKGVASIQISHNNNNFETLDCSPITKMIYEIRSSDNSIGELTDV